MTDEQQKFIEGFNAVISDCAILCFCTRDTELQNAACLRLEQLRSSVEVEKTKPIEGQDECFANDLLGCSCPRVCRDCGTQNVGAAQRARSRCGLDSIGERPTQFGG